MSKSEQKILLDDESIEKALDFLEEGSEMTEEQLDAMIADERVIASVSGLLDMREATLVVSPLGGMNVDDEWQKFRHTKGIPADEAKATHRSAWIYAMVGVAATLLVLFGFSWLKEASKPAIPGDMVLTATEDVAPHPVITTDEGEEIVLDGTKKATRQLASLGAKVDARGEMVQTGKEAGKKNLQTITIPRGQTYKLVLADGSEVWLNTDCHFTYPSRFVGGERRVRLEGEAYFKVKSNPHCPFVVEAGGIETKVLGTEFNVRAYGKADSHVTLIRGSVVVSSKEAPSHHVKLVPGEETQLMEDGSFETGEVDVDSYVYWKEGFFYFDDVSLENMMLDIGRWYNLNVVFQREAAKTYRMHFIADRKSGVRQIIKLLNGMGKVDVELVDNSLIIK